MTASPVPSVPDVPGDTAVDSLRHAIGDAGFAFVPGSTMRRIIATFGSLSDWEAFSKSWNDLEVDTYMADGGRYRRRRHGVFSASSAGAIVREPHQPHYQSVDYNPLNGGVERWFAPLENATADSQTMQAILECCRSLFGALAPQTPRWRIEVHQFRIEAREGQAGRPTPEGLHRDGVDYVLVLLVNRRNIASGVTGIRDLQGTALSSFTLTTPFDAAIVDDQRVAHGVTPVEPLQPGEAAHRDVLVVTFVGRP